MVEQYRGDGQGSTGKMMKRRDILAAVGAIVAGLVAKQASQPVMADGETVTAGGTFPETRFTEFVNHGNLPAIVVESANCLGALQASMTGSNRPAVYAESTDGLGAGIVGVSRVSSIGSPAISIPANVGVYGVSTVGAGAGVHGACNEGFGVGTKGESSSYFGVLGSTDTGIGIVGDVKAGGAGTSNIGVLGRIGVAAPNSQSNTVGVYGQNVSTGSGGIGVRGQIANNSAPSTIAVYGENLSTNTGGSPGNGGFGVYGYSLKGHGLVGATGTAGGGGVVGSTNGVAGAYAAISYGPVAITGGKSAAVKNADGSHSLLYCVESPESWFEDFGEGTLANGKAEIKIDPQFAKVADMGKYHVFVTAHDTDHHIAVTNRTGGSFAVTAVPSSDAAAKGKQANGLAGTFSYRIVAKRKDITGERFARVHLPPEPQRPSVPIVESPRASPPQKP